MSLRKLVFAGSFAILAGCSVTSEPLSSEELALTADQNIARVTQDQEAVTRPISLYEAMARALKYNLDHRVELMAAALADSKLALANSDMLPELVANGGYSGRDKGNHSFSRTLSGIDSLEPSTSREKHVLTKDLTFSWHILDFGLSWVRARQAADNAMLASERRRKVINGIIEDVRTAYWRAVSADRLLAGFQALEKRIGAALSNSRALRRDGFTSPAAELTFQRELLDIKRNIQRLERELRTSRIQLAALINLDPSRRFDLVIPERRLDGLNLQIASREMMRLALLNRPEIREVAYKGRINAREGEAALLELLPGIQLYAGTNFDSNSFLLNNSWVGWGAKAGWNLMRLFAYPAKQGVIGAEAALIDQQALATTMAIMTQVEVARLRYGLLRRSADTARQYYAVQVQLRDHVKASAGVDAASEQSLIREEMNTLVASADYDIAFADLQNAFAAIYTSIGVDPWGDELDVNLPVDELTARLRDTWRARGDNGG
ncbi:MAG: TolC family protein [Rhizobiaceae bacterium]